MPLTNPCWRAPADPAIPMRVVRGEIQTRRDSGRRSGRRVSVRSTNRSPPGLGTTYETAEEFLAHLEDLSAQSDSRDGGE